MPSSRLFCCRLHQVADQAYTSNYFDKAFVLYSEAIDIDPEDNPTNAVLFANRAAVLMNLGRDQEALQDCNEASVPVFLGQPILCCLVCGASPA